MAVLVGLGNETLSISLHHRVLLRNLGDLSWSQVNYFILKPTLSTLGWLILLRSLGVNHPVNMEVLNRAHNHLGIMKEHFILTVGITSNDPPDLSKKHLL
jgi:hypothetical protein